MKILLWQEERVTVHIDSGHVRIFPKRPLTHPRELSRNEVIEMWKTSKKVASVFFDVFKTRDHFIYTPVQKNRQQFYHEIIPADGSTGEVNIAEKMHRAIYVISSGLIDRTRLTADQTRKVIIASKSRFELPVYREIKIVKWKRIQEAKEIVSKAIKIESSDKSCSASDNPKGEFDVEHGIDRKEYTITRCAFCLDRVINNQLIEKEKYHDLLYNYKPYIPGKHLLAVSRMHKPTEEHFSEDEIWEGHLLFLKVGRAFESLFGKRIPYCRFLQNGLLAGQTVPHAHAHFLAGTGQKGLQMWLKRVSNELKGKSDPPLSAEEMLPVIKSYQTAINTTSAKL